jgi:hypothetical protein
MNEIRERVLANSFSGIHKSKIICSEANKGTWLYGDRIYKYSFMPPIWSNIFDLISNLPKISCNCKHCTVRKVVLTARLTPYPAGTSSAESFFFRETAWVYPIE